MALKKVYKHGMPGGNLHHGVGNKRSIGKKFFLKVLRYIYSIYGWRGREWVRVCTIV